MSSKRVVSPNKEELCRLYVNNNTYDIAKMFMVDRTTVSNWLKKYNIAIRNKQAEYELNRLIKLTEIQKQFLLGTMLGDGHIELNTSKRLARFSISHGSKQLGYIKWKSDILYNISRGVKKHIIHNNQVNTDYTIYRLSTTSTEDLLDMRNLFYHNKTKVITKDLLKCRLSPLSLAVWVSDDGTLNKSKRIDICSDSFTYKEHVLLKKLIYNNFNINAKIIKHKGNNRLHFTVKETRKLVSIIEPHMIDDMKYKTFI